MNYTIKTFKIAALSLLLMATSWSVFSEEDSSLTASAETTTASVTRKKAPTDIRRIFLPGNALQIRVFPDTTSFLNGVYPIASDGSIDLPIVGRVSVAKKAPDELAAQLEQEFIEYLPHPNVQVTHLIRAATIGGFLQPGHRYVDPNFSLWNLVQLSGGTQREDGYYKIRWHRNGEIIHDNVIPFLESGRSLYDIDFQSGDQLVITNHPKRGGWERFQQTAFPALSLVASLISTTVTVIALSNNLADGN